MDKIEYRNKEFPIRVIEFEFGKRLISTESLQALIIKDGVYKSQEAIITDEQIFYYVEDNKIDLNSCQLIDEIDILA